MARKFEPITFLQRLREAFNGLSIDTIGRKIGVQKQAIYRWGRGETQPDLDRLLLISELTGFSIHWLITGEGSKKVESAEYLEGLKNRLEELEIEIVKDVLLRELVSLSNRKQPKEKVG